MITLQRFLFAFLFLSTSAYAAGKSSSTTPMEGFGLAWIAAGGGNATSLNPAPEMSLDTVLMATAGLEYDFVKEGILGVTFGGNWFTMEGKLNYDYTSPANVHYTSNNVKIVFSGEELFLGLKLKPINLSWFRIYGEGGGTVGTGDVKYTADATIIAKGNDYTKEDSGIMISGLYGEAGLEFLPINGYGIKAGARYTMHTTGDITAFASQKVRYEEAYGYFGIAKAF